MRGTPVEIIAVGRELLTGSTLDTNSAWLAGYLPTVGARVARIVIVDDDPPAIAREIRHARANGSPLVITTGGLGPTIDDRTLVGVAAALGRPLFEHPGALAAIARRYAELSALGAVDDAELTPPRRKMAMLPEGATFLDNLVGTAPGVFVSTGAFAVLSVPGAPHEMRVLMTASTELLLGRLGGPLVQAERVVDSGCGDESRLTTILDRLMAAHPTVRAKSVATPSVAFAGLRIRIAAEADSIAEAEERVDAAARALLALLPTPRE